MDAVGTVLHDSQAISPESKSYQLVRRAHTGGLLQMQLQ